MGESQTKSPSLSGPIDEVVSAARAQGCELEMEVDPLPPLLWGFGVRSRLPKSRTSLILEIAWKTCATWR